MKRHKLTKTITPLTARTMKSRSIVTNGKHMPDVDGRSSDARRYRDLIAIHEADLGGNDVLSEGQRAIVRRIACITVECERAEQGFVNDGGATAQQLETYQRAANTLRRMFETLRLHRGRLTRDVTPPDLSQYIRSKNGHHTIIDHEDDE